MGNCIGCGLVSRLTTWIKQPFNTQMDIWGWFWFGLLVMVIAIFWGRVIRDIKVVA